MVQTFSPGTSDLGCRVVPPTLDAEILCHHGLRCACPNMHKAQGGKLLSNLRKLLGSTPNLHRRSIVVKGKWKSLLCKLRNSCCSGDRCRGEQNVLTSSSVRHFDAEPYSGAELAIQPISGLEVDRKCSRIVVMSLPLSSVTTKRNTPASSIAIDFTRTRPDQPSIAQNKVLPSSNNSCLTSVVRAVEPHPSQPWQTSGPRRHVKQQLYQKSVAVFMTFGDQR